MVSTSGCLFLKSLPGTSEVSGLETDRRFSIRNSFTIPGRRRNKLLMKIYIWKITVSLGYELRLRACFVLRLWSVRSITFV